MYGFWISGHWIAEEGADSLEPSSQGRSQQHILCIDWNNAVKFLSLLTSFLQSWNSLCSAAMENMFRYWKTISHYLLITHIKDTEKIAHVQLMDYSHHESLMTPLGFSNKAFNNHCLVKRWKMIWLVAWEDEVLLILLRPLTWEITGFLRANLKGSIKMDE